MSRKFKNRPDLFLCNILDSVKVQVLPDLDFPASPGKHIAMEVKSRQDTERVESFVFFPHVPTISISSCRVRPLAISCRCTEQIIQETLNYIQISSPP